jgi:hypothetical protein
VYLVLTSLDWVGFGFGFSRDCPFGCVSLDQWRRQGRGRRNVGWGTRNEKQGRGSGGGRAVQALKRRNVDVLVALWPRITAAVHQVQTLSY